MLEFSERSQTRARKRHMCHICGKAILPGCEYIHEKQKYDGEFHDLKRHLHCDAILDAYLNDRGENEYSDDEVFEYLSDICGELFAKWICPEEDYYEKCDKDRCFECPLIFKRLLNPSIVAAMEADVKANKEALHE